MAKINEYRCTRSSRWVGGKPGNEVSPEDRLGYFVRAEDGDEALGVMLARFPDEDITVSLSRENVGALKFPENPSKAAKIPSAEIAEPVSDDGPVVEIAEPVSDDGPVVEIAEGVSACQA